MEADRDEIKAWFDRFTLMDDAYMAKFFEGQPRCAEAVLRPLLGIPDLEVVSLETHHDVVSLQGRSASLDVFATDGRGAVYDIEIQRDLRDAMPRRARFYASLIDSNALGKGTGFDELPESYVVFICEGDALGDGVPLCRIRRVVDETGKPFDDGSHIVYADATYNGFDGALGDVLHDFLCADPEQMRCGVLAERARFLKRVEKGESEMSNVTEEIINYGIEKGIEQGIEQGVGRSVARLVEDGTLSVEQIAAILEIAPNEVERYAREYAVR